MCDKYQGWSNRETWAMALYIDNDQALLEIALDYAKQEIDGHDDGESINTYHLGQTLEGWVIDDLLTYESVSENEELWVMLLDVGSLYRVAWRELADHYLEQVKEEEKV